MLKQIKKSKTNQKGFTIIEVLIVLAIAGLILLIVFLAVPALQRSSRNTQRKNDAAAIGSSIANYISNNGGQLPTGVGGDGTNTNNILFYGSTSNTETAKLGYYTVAAAAGSASATNSGNVSLLNVTAVKTPTVVPSGTAPATTTITTDQVLIYTGENCDSTGTKGGTLSTRTAAIFYVAETGSGDGSLQCIEQ